MEFSLAKLLCWSNIWQITILTLSHAHAKWFPFSLFSRWILFFYISCIACLLRVWFAKGSPARVQIFESQFEHRILMHGIHTKGSVIVLRTYRECIKNVNTYSIWHTTDQFIYREWRCDISNARDLAGKWIDKPCPDMLSWRACCSHDGVQYFVAQFHIVLTTTRNEEFIV